MAEDEEIDWCFWCDGSGEGYASDTNCRHCSGLGSKELEYESE